MKTDKKNQILDYQSNSFSASDFKTSVFSLKDSNFLVLNDLKLYELDRKEVESLGSEPFALGETDATTAILMRLYGLLEGNMVEFVESLDGVTLSPEILTLQYTKAEAFESIPQSLEYLKKHFKFTLEEAVDTDGLIFSALPDAIEASVFDGKDSIHVGDRVEVLQNFTSYRGLEIFKGEIAIVESMWTWEQVKEKKFVPSHAVKENCTYAYCLLEKDSNPRYGFFIVLEFDSFRVLK